MHVYTLNVNAAVTMQNDPHKITIINNSSDTCRATKMIPQGEPD